MPQAKAKPRRPAKASGTNRSRAKASTSKRRSNSQRSSKQRSKAPVAKAKEAAQRSKLPAVVAGSLAAGLAGGIVVGQRALPKRKVLGIPLPRRSRATVLSKQLGKAAGEIGRATGQVGELTSEVRGLRQEVENGKGKSPVEVLLSGLTRRRG